MSDILKIEVTDHIAVLTINRPKALNALNNHVITEIGQFISEGYKAHEGLIGIILTGEGEKAFAAGADIKAFLSLDKSKATDLSKTGQDVFQSIEDFHLPVIAAVNGFALGGGCELCMSCHLRVASENAKFGQPEVNLGLVPGYGGTQRLPQLIGKAKAMELTLTGDMIDAAEAHRLGLANHVVSQDELMDKCKSIIKKIGKKGPTAISKSIELINAAYKKDKDGFAIECNVFGELMVSEETKEGVTAFIEKRKANFKR